MASVVDGWVYIKAMMAKDKNSRDRKFEKKFEGPVFFHSSTFLFARWLRM